MERFTLPLRESFDYTKRQCALWSDKIVEEISQRATPDRLAEGVS